MGIIGRTIFVLLYILQYHDILHILCSFIAERTERTLISYKCYRTLAVLPRRMRTNNYQQASQPSPPLFSECITSILPRSSHRFLNRGSHVSDMPYLLSATMRASILVAAATANQLALSVPSPKLSVIELTADEAKTLHDAMYRPKWLIYSISTWKASSPI